MDTTRQNRVAATLTKPSYPARSRTTVVEFPRRKKLTYNFDFQHESEAKNKEIPFVLLTVKTKRKKWFIS